MKIKRNSETLNKVIHQFFDRYSIPHYSSTWVVKESQLGGFGVFAKRDIEVGEIIFIDYPIILGPRAGLTYSGICVNCYNNDRTKLFSCEKNCGLTLCSLECQNSSTHKKECKVISQWKTADTNAEEMSRKMIKCLSPIRSLLLSSEDKEVVQSLKAHMGGHHGFEVDLLKEDMKLNLKEDEENFMRFVCAVLDANAFEVIIGTEEKESTLRGLYPLGGLANHNCIPNTFHVFDDRQRMVVRASVFIPEGEEIFHTYTRLIWGTPTRRYHLYRTKHFLCKCKRCCDPTEMKSYMSALKCSKCCGNVLPLDPLKLKTKWQCEGCTDLYDEKFVASRMSLLGSTLASFEEEDVNFMLRFLTDKLPPLVSSNNQVIIETEYKLIWILGHTTNFLWHELSMELLSLKEKMCRHILSVLEILGTGWSKMRGLLLYEIYCCIKWKNKMTTSKGKEIQNIPEAVEMKSLSEECAEILMYDVAAPEEIKKLWIQKEIYKNKPSEPAT